MIYLLDVDIDYGRLGDQLQAILPEEWAQTQALVEGGRMLGIWRKANAKGVIAIWNMPDHEAVNAQIRAMPLYPWMTRIEITPLVAHPRYPEFCAPRG
jgi:muconolactone delta-isomerase